MNKIKIFIIFVSAILSSSQTGFALFDRFFEKLSHRFTYSTLEQGPFSGWIVARNEEDNKLAGEVSYSFDYDAVVSNCCLNFLLVRDGYRGKGLGTELLKRAIGKLADKGCEEVHWQADPFMGNLTQAQLNAFYSKRGGVKQDSQNNFIYKIRPQLLVKRENLMTMLSNQGDLFAPDSN